MRPLRQFKQLDPFLDVALVRGLMGVGVAHYAALLGAEVAGLSVEELVIDAPIELVHVHRVDAVLNPFVLAPELGDRLVVELLLVGMAFVQGLLHPAQHLIAERNPLKQRGELLLKDFFPRERLRALTLVPGAVIVHVSALLYGANESAAAMAAGDEPAEREVVGALLRPLQMAAVENGLHLLPQVSRDDRLESARVGDAVVVVIAGENPLPEQLLDCRGGNRVAALSVDQPILAGERRNLLQRVLPTGIPLEHSDHHRRELRVRHDDLLPVRAVHVEVAERRERRPDSLSRFLVQPLPDLLAEVVDIVLRHQDLDPVHELLRRARVRRQNDVLFDEVDFEDKLVDRHPVFEIPVEAVGLLDQHQPAGGRLLKQGDHLAEARPAGLLRGLDVDELLQHRESIRTRIAAQQFHLGRDGEALLLLILRGNAGVDDAGAPSGGRRFSGGCLILSHRLNPHRSGNREEDDRRTALQQG